MGGEKAVRGMVAIALGVLGASVNAAPMDASDGRGAGAQASPEVLLERSEVVFMSPASADLYRQ